MHHTVKLSLTEQNSEFGRDVSESGEFQIMIDDTMAVPSLSIPHIIPALQLISMTIRFFDRGCYFRLGPPFCQFHYCDINLEANRTCSGLGTL
jgi:hypothetical protein